MGEHADPRDDEATGLGDVCRRETASAAAASRAVSLLRVRHSRRAYGRLRRGQWRVLPRTAGVARSVAEGAVGRRSRTSTASSLGATAARVRRAAPRWSSRARRGPTEKDTQGHAAAARRAEPLRQARRDARRRATQEARRRRRHPQAARHALARQEVRRRRRDEASGAVLELGVCDYRALRRYIERRPAPPVSLAQIDPLIRQLSHYRELIDQKTERGNP